jgi:photosystem II stability/assembly factor-like uncharacterized protein
VAVVPGQDKVIALTGNTLQYETVTAWSSTDGGATWVQLGQGANSEALEIAPIGIRFDPKNADVFWIYGNFPGANGGIYKTTDGGNTFASVYPTGMDINSAEDMSVAAGSNTVLATQHERSQSLYKSTDGGTTWTSIGASFPSGTAYSQYTAILDSNTYLLGCSFAIDGTWDTGSGTKGIYRTTDGGATWTQVANGYEVFASPTATNGALYWAYYNGSDGGILTSQDAGVTWSVLVPNHLVFSVTPVALPSGQIASVNTSNQVVLFTPGTGSTTTLGGTIGVQNVFGLVYDAARNALFTWQMTGGIERLDLSN